MVKKISKRNILKRNPHISGAQLDASIILTQQLIASGMQLSGYNLASPFTHRRLKKGDAEFTYTWTRRLSHRL